ncbi:alpha/beta hydrolase, partial [Candidatus Pacearchaeota archaeon]|nr:alpha/beta hydrolase [Candidatus Pacearchaeota archaeon]MBD3283628.1 alpha/beta hydrolase [Candidatus Pacearchaeota archaeon]
NQINNEKNCQSKKQIINISISKIDILEKKFSGKILEDLKPKCCLFNECHDCCDDSCYFDEDKFPIIFIHGHDFGSDISPEYNLNIFDSMQRALEKDYLNAGNILINVPEETLRGIWGKIKIPISVKASYYFDIIRDEKQIELLQTKTDNIETYAIRLKGIIETVKHKTNRNKVVLISHSMGGLVIRRYLQIFGENSVDKVIMISTPNNGLDSETTRYCNLFGESEECDDMRENSLLINKLKNQKNLGIEIHNIVGIGCETNGETGDGVVKNNSAYLEFAENYFIKGDCSGFQYLHGEIIKPEKYPKTLEIIKEILEVEGT